jgi:predicted nucleotidyltransferase
MAQDSDAIVAIVKQFLDAVQQQGVCLQAAYLFGSCANETMQPDSDIDVALISDDFTGDIVHDAALIALPLWRSDPRIEHVRYRLQDLRDEDPLAWEIKTKGLRLL